MHPRIDCFRQVRKMKKDISGAVGEKLAIPAETLGEVPVVLLRGKRSISIENHRGITEYKDTTVTVAVKRGCVRVSGNALCIARMTRKSVEIRGTIRTIELE